MATPKKWQITSISRSGNEICISDSWRNDYAIRYEDGRIAYDHPESLPKYIKEEVKKQFDAMFSENLMCVHVNCKYNKLHANSNGYCRHMNGVRFNVKTGLIKEVNNVVVGCRLHKLDDGECMQYFTYVNK